MRANFVISGVAAGIRRNLSMTVALILSTSIALARVFAPSSSIRRANGSTDARALPTSVKYFSIDPAEGHMNDTTTMRRPVKWRNCAACAAARATVLLAPCT